MRILSFGGGVDSSAILYTHLFIEDLGIDQVIFSDTGAESQGTYDNIAQFKEWCDIAGLPFQIVRREGGTITDWVLSNGTVPVMAGGPHVCSVKFKGEVIHKWVDQNFPDQEITYLIGIEANEGKRTDKFDKKQSARFSKPKAKKTKKQAAKIEPKYEYPLQDRGMTRQDCIDLLKDHNLNVPKSSCVFCPFMSKAEIREVHKDPKAWATIKLVEDTFKATSPRKHQAWLDAGKPVRSDGKCLKGHWRKDSWKEGVRLFIRPFEDGGKPISVDEWDQKLRNEQNPGATDFTGSDRDLINRVKVRLEKENELLPENWSLGDLIEARTQVIEQELQAK
jgi:hypothetical protein